MKETYYFYVLSYKKDSFRSGTIQNCAFQSACFDESSIMTDTTTDKLSSIQLINAFYILFGYSISNPYSYLTTLNTKSLKAAYRKKVFATHPDRANILNKDIDELYRSFIKTTSAYNTLKAAVNLQKPKIVFNKKNVYSKKTETKYYKRKTEGLKKRFISKKIYIPKRSLKIGEFLYYLDYISWKTLIKSISWQRSLRPVVGQIALNWEILSRKEIKEILEQRRQENSFKIKFCEFAFKKNYMSSFEKRAVLGKQQSLQKPIGTYLIQNNILSANLIDQMVDELNAHNQMFVNL